jgi:transposase
VAVKPIDMRLGVDGLSLHVQESLGRPPCDGSAYAFRNRSGTRIKLLIWDGTGVWLCARRLHKGHFIWPQSHEETCVVSNAEWQWLIAGIDWTRLQAQAKPTWRV